MRNYIKNYLTGRWPAVFAVFNVHSLARNRTTLSFQCAYAH